VLSVVRSAVPFQKCFVRSCCAGSRFMDFLTTCTASPTFPRSPSVGQSSREVTPKFVLCPLMCVILFFSLPRTGTLFLPWVFFRFSSVGVYPRRLAIFFWRNLVFAPGLKVFFSPPHFPDGLEFFIQLPYLFPILELERFP